MRKIILPLLLLAFLLGACKPKTSLSPEAQISIAVSGTLTALPQPIILPTYTPYPTLAPQVLELQGLFCEYKFCIGHPQDSAFFDARQAENPSAYSEGMLASYRPDLFTLVVWQLNRGTDDPQFMLDLVMEDGLDERRGTLDVNLLGNLTTFYSAISSNAAEKLHVGGAAAWMCGDRAFGWKVYTASEEIAQQLFQEAMSKFRCEQ